MDVNRADAVPPVGSGAGAKQERKRHQDEEKPDKGADGSSQHSPWAGSQAFAMEGLLASGMTPEIQKAFDSLARQIEPLRAEVERSRGREAHFKELAEKHAFMPIASRREFLRELAHVLNNMHHLTPPNLAILHVGNADDVRRRFGRHALDALLGHVCDAIRERLDPTDIMGSLGGNDFGVILLAGDRDQAGAKTTELIAAATGRPFAWHGAAIAVDVVGGTAALTGATTAEAAVEAADRNLTGTIAAASKPAGGD